MNVICTIKTLYGEESYFFKDVKEISDIELTLQRSLESICHDYDYILKRIEFVDENYIKYRKKAIQIYENIFDESPEDEFGSGEFTTLETILNELNETERKTKMKYLGNEREMEKAVGLLIPLLEGMAEDRGSHVEVWAETYQGTDKIYVEINKAKYEVNVTAMNMRSMVRSVVDAVALKF